jgi:hypothetical protein
VTSVTGSRDLSELIVCTGTIMDGRIQMRNTKLFAVAAALILAAVGGWAASTTDRSVAAPTRVSMEPLQIMMTTTDLPEQHFKDFSVIFD